MLKILAIAFLLLTPFRWIFVVDKAKCNGCGNCLYSCPMNAITMSGPDAYIDPELCDGCGICVNYCPRNAIFKEWYTGIEEQEGVCESISFSHNPVTGTSVTVRGLYPLSEVIIIDQSGRIVFQDIADNNGELLLDMSDKPDGSYLVVSDDRFSTFTSI